MKKTKSIRTLCKELSILSVISAIFFASIVSTCIFFQFSSQQQKIELQRLHDIAPLILRPIEANYIVGDNRSIVALMNQLTKQYRLSNLHISKYYANCSTWSSAVGYFSFLNNKPVCLTTILPRVKPEKFITITSSLAKYNLNSLLKILAWVNISLMLLGIFISWALNRKLKKYIVNPINLLAKEPNQFLPDIYTALEITDLHTKFTLFISELERQRDVIQEHRVKQSAIKIATQVAHDIRSPLAAINTAVFDIRAISEMQRTIIKNAAKRINDIANNLLLTIKNNNHALDDQEELLQAELIFCAVESIVVEKRYEYCEKSIHLKLNISESAYHCFSKINMASFKRILSNLINNSVESSTQSDHLIELFLKYNYQNIEIVIQDHGCGIPSDMLTKVTEEGFSYRKHSTGVGLSYAKKQIEQFGGQFFIRSEINMGTKITILLPTSPFPIWFCNSIALQENSVILILDDDCSIHDVWKEKFFSQKKIRLIHLHTAPELTSRLLEEIRPDLCLIDYELFPGCKDGAELIKQFNLIQNSILVTNAFECTILRETCRNIGLKILPKPYVPYVPIQYVKQSSETIVLIDDNESLRMVWEFSAIKIGKNIATYSSPQDFIKDVNYYDKNTIIYIDSELKADVKGEVWAKDLCAMGFSEIHLVTGHAQERFGNMPWIKSILGKEPPFFTHNS